MRASDFIQRVKAAEAIFETLVKFEPKVADALKALDAAVKAGALHPDHAKTVRQEIATDKLIPTMGNVKAYQGFLQSRHGTGGIHIRMDGNDFGDVNKVHGFERGNEGIQQYGTALREAMNEAVGRKHGKLFRIGGDEFHAFVPDHESAARFSRALRYKLERLAPIGGTHRFSMSLGIGGDHLSAERALIQAKMAKKAAKYPMGQAKSHAHSLVPGFEGPIPLDGGFTPQQSSTPKP
jgi:GGDEF domain-containing protein